MPRGYPGLPWPTLAVISAGGAIGALARYGLIVAFPERDGAFAWPVFWINVAGCSLIGIVIVICTEVRRAHRLLRAGDDVDFRATDFRKALQQCLRCRAEIRRRVIVVTKMFPAVGGEDGDFHSAIF